MIVHSCPGCNPAVAMSIYLDPDERRRFVSSEHEYFNYSSLGTFEVGTRRDILLDAVLQLDGFDRFQVRDAGYFRLVQPWQYHTVVPEESFVYSYSFALKPEEVQPCGSMNASRMDSIVLQVNINPALRNLGTLHTRVYAINHNVFRVADGFGGVLFTI